VVARSAAATSSKIRVCSVCHKNGHTKRNCPELANFGKHDVPVERVETAPVVVVTGERSLDERLKADRAKAQGGAYRRPTVSAASAGPWRRRRATYFISNFKMISFTGSTCARAS